MSEKWNVDIDINHHVYEGTKELDYNIEYAESRLELVNQIIDELNKDNILVNYLSSEGYIRKQVKTKSNFLAESEMLSRLLERFSSYLNYAKYDNEEGKMKNEKKKQPLISKDRRIKNSKKESFTDCFSEINENNIVRMEYDKRIKPSDINFRLMPRQEITDKDRREFKELDEYASFLEFLDNLLGYGKGINQDERRKIQTNIKKNYDEKYLSLLNRIRKELIKDMPIIKDQVRRTIYFKKLDKGHPEYDFENDTGYFHEDGNYIEISENKFDLSEPKHIFGVISNYGEIKEGCWDKPYSDLWIILHEVEKLIDTYLEPYEKDIIVYKIDKLSGSDISKLIKEKYSLKISERKLSKLYNETIPKKIADAHKQQYEDWLYTYRVKGNYKACSKCGEVKLMKDSYFGKSPITKDGFQSTCKKCDNLRKNGKND